MHLYSIRVYSSRNKCPLRLICEVYEKFICSLINRLFNSTITTLRAASQKHINSVFSSSVSSGDGKSKRRFLLLLLSICDVFNAIWQKYLWGKSHERFREGKAGDMMKTGRKGRQGVLKMTVYVYVKALSVCWD